MHGDFESLLFGLLFLAVVGFQVLKQFLAARAAQRRRQQQMQAGAGVPQPSYDVEPEPLELTESDWGRAPEPLPVTELPLEVQLALKPRPERQRDAAPAAPRRTDATQQRRRARHRLFHSQRALRHGVVMMTVLGPCRALKPYDQDI
ncbi:MAG: hypothetical protein KIT63_18890 [Rhodoferax sp.]|nr:hypothetical protein [Rhodoferax sp.]